MNFLRGLFGSSARQMIPQSGGTTILRGDPEGDTILDRQLGSGVEARLPPTMVEAPTPSGPNRMSLIGATMQDMGAAFQGGQGGALSDVQEQYRQRTERAKAEAQQAEIERLGMELYGDDPEALAFYRMAPEKLLEKRMEDRQPAKPVLVNTRLGPRLYHPDTGEYRTLEDIPERIPPGYVFDDEGNPVLDPHYLAGQAALAEARASATARHRAPRSSGGGGGAAIPPPPGGWRPVGR